eukprot:s573_g4.t1
MECPGHPPVAPGDWDRARPMGCQWDPQILVGLRYPAGGEFLATDSILATGITRNICHCSHCSLVLLQALYRLTAVQRLISGHPTPRNAQHACSLFEMESSRNLRDTLGKHSGNLARWAMSIPSKYSKMCQEVNQRIYGE